jgi:ribosomal protein S18 acetylase RimI-like enzyme
VFFVAVDGDSCIGFAAGTITRPTASELLGLVPTVRGRIIELFVRASHRGAGVGTRLLQATEAYLLEQGCTVLRVEVFVPNQAAHRLYQRLGYHDMDLDMTKVVGS